MIDAGIHEKDMLTVDRKLEARNGQIVVASVDGQSTVKIFQRIVKALLSCQRTKNTCQSKFCQRVIFTSSAW